MIVAVLVPNLGNPVFLPFLRAVEAVVQEHGYSVIVTDTQRRAELERRQLDRLLAQRIDGLIMAGRPHDPNYVSRLGEDGLPIIDPTTWAIDGGHGEVASPVAAIVEACRHLAALGHRRIAFVVRGNTLRTASRRRWDLIATTCRSLRMEPSLVNAGAVPEREHDAGGGTAALVGELLAAPQPPSVLWSNSHVLAPQLLEGLARADIDLPAGCSFLTFGDSPWAAAYRPAINVIAGDLAATGSVVAQTMLHLLGVVARAPDRSVPPDAYCRRASVGPAPGR